MFRILRQNCDNLREGEGQGKYTLLLCCEVQYVLYRARWPTSYVMDPNNDFYEILEVKAMCHIHRRIQKTGSEESQTMMVRRRVCSKSLRSWHFLYRVTCLQKEIKIPLQPPAFFHKWDTYQFCLPFALIGIKIQRFNDITVRYLSCRPGRRRTISTNMS
jgi:hypothetical protein